MEQGSSREVPDGSGGALRGVRIVELAGMGALPFATYKLADMGADIVRVERASEVPADRTPRPHSFWSRGLRSIAVDLKKPAGVEAVLRLTDRADAFLESFRPGVVERLGIGPTVACARNPRLVYARLTGWGQDGPLAPRAGHSLSYESITGVIRAIGPRGGPPVPPLTLLGDFAGGGLSMAYGVVCALFEAQRSGQGQVVDVAMVDGVMSLAAVFYSMHEIGMHGTEMGTNLFDGGAPFYAIYETREEGGYVSVASIEPRFYAELLAGLELDPGGIPDRDDPGSWPELREIFAATFRMRTRSEWVERFAGTDACVAPVLDFGEARRNPHHVAREAFVPDGGAELRPSPRLGRTPGQPGRSPIYPGADTDDVLGEAGFSQAEIDRLRADGAVA